MSRNWKCLLVLLMLDFAVFLRPASTMEEEETGSGDFDEENTDQDVDNDDIENYDEDDDGDVREGDIEEDEEEEDDTGDDDDDEEEEDFSQSGDDPDEEDNEGNDGSEIEGPHDSHEDDSYDGVSGPCTKEFKRLRSLKVGGSVGKKGEKKVDDVFVPHCTENGGYEPRQCSKDSCWCVTEDGIEEEDTRHLASDNYECRPADNDPSFDHGNIELASHSHPSRNASSSSNHPAFLAAIVIMVVMGLAGAVLVAMFVVYRMRKKDEGSYALAHNSNSTAPERRSTRSLIFGGQGGAGSKEVPSHHHQPEPSFYSLQPQLQQALQQQEFYA